MTYHGTRVFGAPMFEQILEEVRETHPQVVEEFERLRLWVFTCVGADVAALGGPKVDE